MPDTFTGDCILEDNKRLRAEVLRCLKFIATIPDEQHRGYDQRIGGAWQKELWAIKREVKA